MSQKAKQKYQTAKVYFCLLCRNIFAGYFGCIFLQYLLSSNAEFQRKYFCFFVCLHIFALNHDPLIGVTWVKNPHSNFASRPRIMSQTLPEYLCKQKYRISGKADSFYKEN